MVISKYIGLDKYFAEMTQEEKDEFSKEHSDEGVIDFIVNTLKNTELK